MLDFGKGWLELRIFAAKTFSSIHYSLKMCSNNEEKTKSYSLKHKTNKF